MRTKLIIEKAGDEIFPNFINYYHIQSSIYSLFRDTELENLHERERYKLFTFSNIFPFNKNTNQFVFLFSSPEEEIVKKLNEQFISLAENNKTWKVGRFKFIIKSIESFDLKLNEDLMMITGTPIVVSIPQKKFKKYKIKPIDSEREYVYWNNDMSLNAFADGVTKNIVRKYNCFFDKNWDENIELFESMEYLGGALMDYKDAQIAGSRWKFKPKENNKALKLLNFSLDVGLGEKNSLGFGFMNIK